MTAITVLAMIPQDFKRLVDNGAFEMALAVPAGVGALGCSLGFLLAAAIGRLGRRAQPAGDRMPVSSAMKQQGS
jgi:hypothetical protein